MKFTIFLTVLACVAATEASWWSWWPWSSDNTPKWNGLRTTFALDGYFDWVPFVNAKGFAGIPRTLQEAVDTNWVKASTSCNNGGLFNGFRYVFKNPNGTLDTAVAVLLDVNGIVAGIQMNIKVSEAKANPNNTYKFDEIPMFQRNTIGGDDVYSLTAYFVDPATICTTGRTATDLTNNGTGSNLSFQNGTTPSQLIKVPNNRTIALTEKWSNNKCFPGMGTHNWYDQEHFQDTNCDTLLPAFLLYNNDNELIGFGFQHVGKSNSLRYELPPDKVVKIIVGEPVSQCLLDKANPAGIGVTTMHVYLIDNPAGLLCAPSAMG